MDPGPTTKLLDVAGGTGDIAFRVMNKGCMSLYLNMQSYICSPFPLGRQRGPEH